MNNKQSTKTNNMEGNSTSKRMKSQIVVKQEEEDDNLSAGPPREGMELVSLSNKNYFTPPIMDVGPEILGHLTDPKDVFSVVNSAPVFQCLLEKRKVAALLPLVLPVLMKKGHLESRDILNCRLLSKPVKAGVDDAIVEQQPIWISEHIYRFTRDEDVDGNPFISRRTMLNLEKARGTRAPLDYVNLLRVLQRFGHELHDVDLTVKFEKRPYTRMRLLKQSLSYLPNVKKLSLDFEEHEDDDALKYNNFRHSPQPFPVLQHLEDLDLDISYMKSYDHDFLTSFVRPILQAYRKQITRLHCESYVFKGTNWESFQFPQLRQLDVYFEDYQYRFDEGDYEWISETFRNVAKLQCPNLESLTLRKRWVFISGGLIITREMFEALDNFRNSLKELDVQEFEEGGLQLFEVDLANILYKVERNILPREIMDMHISGTVFGEDSKLLLHYYP